LSCALGLGIPTPAVSAPIAAPDAPQTAEAQFEHSEPPPTSTAISTITDEELPNWKRSAAIPTAKRDPSGSDAAAQDTSMPTDYQQPSLSVGPLPTQPPSKRPTQNNGDAEPNAEKSIRDAVKESVRPAYEQLIESGMIETWHDVKASLGLDKGQWSEQDRTRDPAQAPNQWNAPDGDAGPHPVQPPRTAAQMQMDREMATMMREKLIDQVKPWLIGLAGLYVVVRLIKLVIRYVRWKAVRRSKRRIAHAQRHTLHRTSSRRSRSRRSRSSSSSPSESKKVG
jgi:hypothetical protein